MAACVLPSPWRPESPVHRATSSLESLILSLGSYAASGHSSPRDQDAHYNAILALCIARRSLRDGLCLRSHIASIGHAPSLFLQNQFVNLFSKCGAIDMARQVFDEMPHRNVVSWNALLSGYLSNGRILDALLLFSVMVDAGPSPNHLTYLTAVRALVATGSRELGKQIHGRILKEGFLSRAEVANCLINMYSKFGELDDAETVYCRMVERDTASWNSLIALKARRGHTDDALVLFVDMLDEGFAPDEFTFGTLLSLQDTTFIRELHGQITKRALCYNLFVGTALVDAYGRFGNVKIASQIFDLMHERNVVAWNSVISACFANGKAQEGLRLFLEMGEQGLLPDEYTISILLKAAASQLSVLVGRQFHGVAIKMGLQTNAMIGNSLIMMYAKNEWVSDSFLAFKDISEHDLISWNSIVQCYLQNEEPEQAWMLFVEMKSLGFQPDEFSFVGALAACASLARHQSGREVHGDMIKRSIISDAFIGSALIDMYSKSMVVSDAWQVFSRVKHKDLIIWNALISGLSQNGYLDEVFKLLYWMREEDFEPDKFTFASIFAACANTMAVQQGRQVQGLILKSELNADAAVANSLITMYCRAGCLREARQVFFDVPLKNVVSWTAMIGGCAQSGYSQEALKIFAQMQKDAVKPNAKTFVALLTACSYAGLSNDAGKFFEMMEVKYSIQPSFDHYACMVDILGRAGRLNEAENLIKSMPFQPDALVWRMLLSACRVHGDVERGRRAMERILALEPGDSAAYILLSNLYASIGNWHGVEEVRELMRVNGVKKEPGKSWIEVNARIHEFVAGGSTHPNTKEIYLRLKGLLKQMKDEGYITGIERL
ncbi:pentatricopeptide repeat-containing protein At2g33680-like [Zingiber officinale]|uniref:pentatricopeptide repeat-containing protein At2g33680-like n=1 Tax=Zingiber officinale TaxID=94328 RepID=UPI001C4CDC5B|nr:pentatricopeptide repeat-containing protein At2g33680-like [Zingiber officinale]XP_042379671.1 pentatricopeptide repeat-containing protein At2g33680-like [Zingiber officinale]XP_042379672.1 pentatricopeptide repeat-containing protein At2g33680-like [Zingiber officinale]